MAGAASNHVPIHAGDEEDLTIPRAAMNKLIKELLPNIRVSNEARELVLNCCSEFIHLIASEANDICNKQHKKTINPEHVLAALDGLWFSSYKVDAEAVLNDCKAVAAKKRRKGNRLENQGIPVEELLRQQQELIAQAKQQQLEEDRKQWFQMQALLQQQQQMQPSGVPFTATSSSNGQSATSSQPSHDTDEYE